MNTENNDTPRGRGIYLLPNLFTLSALFAGFYAVITAMQGHFSNAAIAIFIGMLMDTLDGRVARLTHTQTLFGAELDSLSDMVSFGMAPALVLFMWSLSALGKFGWLVAFIYAAAVALRLARFNVQASVDKRYFKGLACTPAAGVMAGMVWNGSEYGIVGAHISILVALVTLLMAFLMVSNLPYRSFKDLDIKGRVPFIVILILLVALVFIAYDPPPILLLVFFCYAFSAPVVSLWKYRQRRKTKKSGGN